MAWLIGSCEGGGAALTREERRALRAIEEALEAEDPRLAELLREPPALRRKRRLRRLRWSGGTFAAILILLGLILSSPELMFAGLVTLLAFPAMRWWAAQTAEPGDP
jgi:Protein of unknown function (DUF3040)